MATPIMDAPIVKISATTADEVGHAPDSPQGVLSRQRRSNLLGGRH